VDKLLGGYKGFLVADAHSVYDRLYENGNIIEVRTGATRDDINSRRLSLTARERDTRFRLSRHFSSWSANMPPPHPRKSFADDRRTLNQLSMLSLPGAMRSRSKYWMRHLFLRRLVMRAISARRCDNSFPCYEASYPRDPRHNLSGLVDDGKAD